MRRLKIIFICKLTICLLTWSVFVTELDALRGSAVVLQAKAKADKKNLDQDEPIDVDENGEQVELNVTTTTKPTLTGIPQIDYVYDPNLPRELNGYNLSDYPFLNSVPQEIDFKCDGLHDGFYASMPHKCQLYHHCLFGTRFDFLCANYTAFDQKTFICHFVSQVDCPNSAKYYNRNEALYKTAETTTLSTTTTSTSTTAAPPPPPPLPPQQSFYPQQQYQQPQQYHQQQQYQQQMPYESRRAMPPGYGQGRKRRPAYRRRRPVYEYYYVDDYDDQPEYYDESVEHMPIPKKHIRKHSRFNNYNKQTNLEVDYPESSSEPDTPPSGNYKINRGSQQQQHQKQQPQHSQQSQQSQQQQQQQSQTTVVTKNVSNQIMSVYDKPRAPPKIRRPVPINERDRYDYTSASKTSQQAMVPAMVVSTTTPITVTTTMAAVAPAAKPKGKEQQSSTEEPPVEYYDDEEEDVPDDEYALEPNVAPAAKPEVAALKPEPVKPIKAAPRTSVVTDYDTDHSRRTSVTTVVRPKANRASTPQPVSTAVRKKPASDHVDVADDYEDELPAAATRQSIAAATKQRPSGPFLARPPKPAKAKTPQLVPVVPDDEEEEPGTYIQQQQPSQAARQPQRVSVRQVMAAPHRNRPQQQTTDHLHAQYNSNNNNKQIRAAATVNNRRPARPVYEYADEYYDE